MTFPMGKECMGQQGNGGGIKLSIEDHTLKAHSARLTRKRPVVIVQDVAEFHFAGETRIFRQQTFRIPQRFIQLLFGHDYFRRIAAAAAFRRRLLFLGGGGVGGI